jgi:arylsulfatase
MPDAQKPNIVLIMADDMGFSDIGAYGSEIETPNLDRLANNGLRFTQMYNSARCCPTRASLLTGLNPHQAGIGHMVSNLGVPAYQGYLNNNCVTIAEVLKAAGYSTMMAGKWHVAGDPHALPPGALPRIEGFPTPRQRGFDRFFGTLGGGGSYYNPMMLMRDDDVISVQTDDFHYTDAISENAAAMLDDAATGEDPFFMYVAYTAPHWPLHAWEEDIARFQGRYIDGWDAIRTSRHEQQKGLGIIDSKWTISPRDASSPPWEETPHHDWQDRRMATYAAQVHQMDRGIGRILAKLEANGQMDNTLIMFLSDNGGCAEFLQEDGLASEPARYRRPTLDGRPVKVGNTPSIIPGPDDTFTSYDLPWANVSNTPFRLFKRYTHEGGISAPLIVHWPAGIKQPGITNRPTHVMDIMASIVEITGAPYPASVNGRDIVPMQGESFTGVFDGHGEERIAPIVWEHEGSRAVRLGDWKLVSEVADPGDPSSRAVWELYNIADDRTELNDLIDGERTRSGDMIAIYNSWAQHVGALPWPAGNAANMRDLQTVVPHAHLIPSTVAGRGAPTITNSENHDRE